MDLVRRLGLAPHPEGGFFGETYRSSGRIPKSALRPARSGDRNFSTAIYYLLPAGTRSRLHRIASDEVWHFYLGGPLELVELGPGAGVRRTVMGSVLAAGQVLQHVVPAGRWFGASPLGKGYSLVGCTVAPGFDFADFQLGERVELLVRFPGARKWVEKYG